MKAWASRPCHGGLGTASLEVEKVGGVGGMVLIPLVEVEYT
jgi:hypothetical protein